MIESKPPGILKDTKGYRLERRFRERLDQKFLMTETMTAIPDLLLTLVGKVPLISEKTFLEEALRCYRVGAFRAAVVMSWNLAFAHLVDWMLSDPARVLLFIKSAQVKFPKKTVPSTLQKHADLEDFKESEVIEILYHASLITKNVTEILREKLKKRNSAAHPNQVVITKAQADDVITDLVNNVCCL
jgi:hypothetical protein